MSLSVFDIFKIGIGPSSSHTTGPMRAARQFCDDLIASDRMSRTMRITVELYGSLALTGIGHGTDRAVILGLLGETPREIDPTRADDLFRFVCERRILTLSGGHEIAFDTGTDILFLKNERLPRHSNGLRFIASDGNGASVSVERFYSVGGGFIVRGDEDVNSERDAPEVSVPHPFESAEDLIALSRDGGPVIWQAMLENEKVWRNEDDIRTELLEIWAAMQHCMTRGLTADAATLPGGMRLRRRAPALYRDLRARETRASLDVLDWVNAFAMAVSEENAAGGRVVTAPTNGAAGVIPAVLHYYMRFVDDATEEGVVRFLLTAGAIGILYKKNAGISGAEMGCQGEVGVACSMAAAGLTEALGASVEQVENAAEIAMEHNLGLTCDPVGGLVQIPCIERNAMGALKAINASRMAVRGDGQHRVSLDQVIRTMRQTGQDMKSIYKETSLGGLAVNVPDC